MTKEAANKLPVVGIVHQRKCHRTVDDDLFSVLLLLKLGLALDILVASTIEPEKVSAGCIQSVPDKGALI
jgi:hypothetical protein